MKILYSLLALTFLYIIQATAGETHPDVSKGSGAAEVLSSTVVAPPNVEENIRPSETQTVPWYTQGYSLLIRERLEVGTRTLSRSYKETKRGDRVTRVGTYFGTINEIRVEDDDSFDRIFLQYRLHKYFGVGVTWDDHRLVTRDGPLPENTDGDFVIDSTYYYVFVRYPLPYGFVPFIEYGRGTHDITFTPEPNWGRRNRIVIADESVSADFYTLGLEYHITRNVSLHVMRRWTNFEFDADYRNIDGRPPLPFTINSDQTITGIGLKVTF